MLAPLEAFIIVSRIFYYLVDYLSKKSYNGIMELKDLREFYRFTSHTYGDPLHFFFMDGQWYGYFGKLERTYIEGVWNVNEYTWGSNWGAGHITPKALHTEIRRLQFEEELAEVLK